MNYKPQQWHNNNENTTVMSPYYDAYGQWSIHIILNENINQYDYKTLKLTTQMPTNRSSESQKATTYIVLISPFCPVTVRDMIYVQNIKILSTEYVQDLFHA